MENKVSLDVLVKVLEDNYPIEQVNDILCRFWEALPEGDEKVVVGDEVFRTTNIILFDSL